MAPSGETFQILARVRSRGGTEFTPLSRVASAADTRDVTTEHVRVNWTNGDLLIDPGRSLNKRNSEFSKNNDTFNHSVKVLMYGYVLISRTDNKDAMWCTLQSATKHITTVENHSRAAARVSTGLNSKLAEAEMAVRREWREVGQAEPSFFLFTVIELVCQRHSIWPKTLELKTVPFRGERRSESSGKNSKGGKKGGEQTLGGSLAEKKRYAKQSGLTVMEPEMREKNNSADGCRATCL